MRWIKSFFGRAPRVRFVPVAGSVTGQQLQRLADDAGAAIGDGFFICEGPLSERDLARLRAAAALGWRPEQWQRLP
jgi:hypothetical protein